MSNITKYFTSLSRIKTLLPDVSSPLSCPDKDVEVFNISYLKSFIHFLESDSTIQKFLKADKCNLLADKYLIALTFAYFVRAKIPKAQFDPLTFFAALHIAHDMEEDELLLKRNLCNWTSHSWEDDEKFYYKRRQFLEKIHFRACVSEQMCEKIMSMNETKDSLLWMRERSSSHAGALATRFRGHVTCVYCREDKLEDRLRRYYQPFGDGYLTKSESELTEDDLTEDEEGEAELQGDSVDNTNTEIDNKETKERQNTSNEFDNKETQRRQNRSTKFNNKETQGRQNTSIEFDSKETQERQNTSTEFDSKVTQGRQNTSTEFDSKVTQGRQNTSTEFNNKEIQGRQNTSNKFDNKETQRKQNTSIEFDSTETQGRQNTSTEFDSKEAQEIQNTSTEFDGKETQGRQNTSTKFNNKETQGRQNTRTELDDIEIRGKYTSTEFDNKEIQEGHNTCTESDVYTDNDRSPIIPDYSGTPLLPDYSASIATAPHESCSVPTMHTGMPTSSPIETSSFVIDTALTKLNTKLDLDPTRDIALDHIQNKKKKISTDNNNKTVKKVALAQILNQLDTSLEQLESSNTKPERTGKRKQSPDLFFSGDTDRSTQTKENEHYEHEIANAHEENKTNQARTKNIQEAAKPTELLDGNFHKPVENITHKVDIKHKPTLNKLNACHTQVDGKINICEKRLPNWKFVGILHDYNSSLTCKTDSRESTPLMPQQKIRDFVKTFSPQERGKHEMILEHYKTHDPEVNIRDLKIQLGKKINDPVNTANLNSKSSHIHIHQEDKESNKGKENVLRYKLKSDSVQKKHFQRRYVSPDIMCQISKNYEKTGSCPKIMNGPKQKSERKKIGNKEKDKLKGRRTGEAPDESTENRASILFDSQTKGCKTNILIPDLPNTCNIIPSTIKLQDMINKIKTANELNIIQDNVKNNRKYETNLEIKSKSSKVPRKFEVNNNLVFTEDEAQNNVSTNDTKIIQENNSSTLLAKQNNPSGNIQKPVQEMTPVSLDYKNNNKPSSTNISLMVKCSKEQSKLLKISPNEKIDIETNVCLETKIIADITTRNFNDYMKSTTTTNSEKSTQMSLTPLTKLSTVEMNENYSNTKKVLMKQIHIYEQELKRNQHSNEEVFMIFPAVKKVRRIQQTPSILLFLEEMKQDQSRILRRMQKKFGIQEFTSKEKDADVQMDDSSNSIGQTMRYFSLDNQRGLQKNKELYDKNSDQYEKVNLDENNNVLQDEVASAKHVADSFETQQYKIDDRKTTENNLVESKSITPIIRDVIQNHQCNTIESRIPIGKPINQCQELETCLTSENKMVDKSKPIEPIIRDMTVNYRSNTREIYSGSVEKAISQSKELQSSVILKPESDGGGTELVPFDLTNTSIAKVHTTITGLNQSMSEINNQMKILGKKIDGIERQFSNKRKNQVEGDLNPKKIARIEEPSNQISGHQVNCPDSNDNGVNDEDIIIIKENIVTKYNVQMVRCSKTDEHRLRNTSLASFIPNTPIIKTEKLTESSKSGKDNVDSGQNIPSEVPQTLQKQSRLIKHTNSQTIRHARAKCSRTTHISISMPENPDTKEKYLHLKIRKNKNSYKQ